MGSFKFVARPHKPLGFIPHWSDSFRPKLFVDGNWTRALPWNETWEIPMNGSRSTVTLNHRRQGKHIKMDFEVWDGATMEFRMKGAKGGFLDVTIK